MADLTHILPSFPSANFAGLLPVLESHSLSTTDLLTTHPADVARQTRLPLLDLKRLIAAVQAELSDDLPPRTLTDPPRAPSLISTLDPDLDAALGGGVPTGRITEFVGESGAGKTQFLLSLSLAVQMPPPHGLSRPALYISTESGLPTTRLVQMLRTNPLLSAAAAAAADGSAPLRPSSDNIRCAVLGDLESQDHVLQYQLPVLVERHGAGLVVIDSVAANYRAEFERRDSRSSRGSNMAARSADLLRLGALLRDLARRHNLAVVVANQVSDRIFSSSSSSAPPPSLASRSGPPPSDPIEPASSAPYVPAPEDPPAPPVLALDHQQRWFTGWGDDPLSPHPPKNPSLGLVWTTQIACRVALFRRPVRRDPADPPRPDGGVEPPASFAPRAWRRWMKVVFAPHAKASGAGTDGTVEFEITASGLKAVGGKPALEEPT